MKKLGFLFAFALASMNAHAMIDLGVVGGVTTNYASSSTMFFTYGITGSIDVGTMFAAGIKATNLSGPSTTSGSVTVSSGQLNLMGQFKYTMSGFFAGINLGVGMTSATVNVGGIGVGASSSALVYGPTVGYYMGTAFKYGIELDYILSSASGWTNTLVPMAGVKFAI